MPDEDSITGCPAEQYSIMSRPVQSRVLHHIEELRCMQGASFRHLSCWHATISRLFLVFRIKTLQAGLGNASHRRNYLLSHGPMKICRRMLITISGAAQYLAIDTIVDIDRGGMVQQVNAAVLHGKHSTTG